jgi:copper/silver efflux system protein
MIAALIRWSARNVFLVGLATVFVTFAGIYAVSRVPLDAIPDLSDVQVIVNIPARRRKWSKTRSPIR